MYADRITDSMRYAIDETNRRRTMQLEYNKVHGITPQTIHKEVHEKIEITKVAEESQIYETAASMSPQEIKKHIKRLEKEMKTAAIALEFETAARLRDKKIEIKKRAESD